MLSIAMLQGLETNAGLIRLIIWVLLLGCLVWAVAVGLKKAEVDATIRQIIVTVLALVLLLVVFTRFGVL
jgi:hypothetical protein